MSTKKDPLQKIGDSLKYKVPKGYAYGMLLYQFPANGKGQVFYLGDGPKSETLGVMKQFIQKHEPGIAYLGSTEVAWLIEHIKQQDCKCAAEKQCDRCHAVAVLQAIPKPELTLHEAFADCHRLAKWLTDLNCGWPKKDEQHPDGMDLVQAITGYVEELRTCVLIMREAGVKNPKDKP